MNNIYKLILDWLHNSWEHCDNIDTEAKEVVSNLGLTLSENETQDLQKEMKSLMTAWINNDYNLRILVQMEYHNDPKHYDEVVLKEFTRQYIKTVAI